MPLVASASFERTMKMKPRFVRHTAVAALFLPLLLVGPLGTSLAQTEPAPIVQGLPDFTPLVDQVGPAVVNIRTLERVRTRGGGGPADDEMQEFFRRFFGVPLPNFPRPNRPESPEPEREVPRGVGSGFIVSADGYVMTNAHVVDGADEVLVTLPDKREFKAKIIGLDKRTDVAVVKIDAQGLPSVRIGNVNRLRVGEWVMAIGSPFGLESTVTAGIVSAKQRDTGDYLPFIQTDVAVNPGNSGGPLINMRGEVVGINSQIYSRSGGFMGISFAIPIDEAMRVSDELRATGRVTRGRIGVQIADVTREVAESIGLGKPRGALVRSVEDGAPADKAGVEAGDIIIGFDGKKIEKTSDLPRLVGQTRPGTQAQLEVFRRGKNRILNVTVGEMPAEPGSAGTAATTIPEAGHAQALGLTVVPLSQDELKELKLKRGVRVERAEGAAARAGLREGDLILSVGNQEITDVRDFEAAVVNQDPNKAVNMLVQRGDLVQFVLVRPDTPER